MFWLVRESYAIECAKVIVLLSHRTQQSVHSTLGTLRVFRQFPCLRFFLSGRLRRFSAPARVTHAVGHTLWRSRVVLWPSKSNRSRQKGYYWNTLTRLLEFCR